MWKIIFALTGLMLAGKAVAQRNTDYRQHWQESQRLNKKGMLILGGWAVGNLALSGLSIGRTDGVTKGFHQMNVYWNLFNLGLASASLLIPSKAPGSLSEAVRKQQNTEKLFLVNAALDVAYIAGGLYLTERSRRNGNRAAQLKGFGRSVMLQGGFLLVFDGIMYAVQNHHGRLLLDGLALSGTENGVGLVMHF